MQEVYEHEEETQNATSSLTHEAENTTTGEESTLPQTASDEDSAFSFVIADPIKKQGTSKLPFWVYKITASTNLPQYKSKTLVIERRYSDFEWLFEKLQLLHPGCIVPPIPEKSALGTVEKIFSNAVDSKQLVQYRQRALLKFMTRVGEHPILQKSQALQQFLEISNERDFDIAKKGKVEKAPQASFGLFKKQVTKEPEWITNLKSFTNYLEEGLKWMKTKLQEMVQRRKMMASSVADFGKGFRHLGLVEKAYEESTMSRSLVEVSQKAELLSGLITAQADRETIHLVETFTYYLGVCEVIKRNVKFLEGLRMARDDATTTLKTQQAALEKLQKTPNVKEEKVKQQEQVVNDAAQKETRLGEDLKLAEDTFKSDVERFNLERKVDFAYMLRSFTILQVEHAESVKTHWESLLPSISLMTSESAPLEPSGESEQAAEPVSLESLSLQPSTSEETTTIHEEAAESFE